LVREPGGWKNFGIYCRFITEEHGRFLGKLKSTPEPAGEGTMLDNTMVLFGSASSAYHLSRNYPLVLAGGQNMGVKQGRYLQHGAEDFDAFSGWANNNARKAPVEELPLSKLYVSMLQKLGVQTGSFGGITGALSGV